MNKIAVFAETNSSIYKICYRSVKNLLKRILRAKKNIDGSNYKDYRKLTICALRCCQTVHLSLDPKFSHCVWLPTNVAVAVDGVSISETSYCFYWQLFLLIAQNGETKLKLSFYFFFSFFFCYKYNYFQKWFSSFF